MPNPIMMMLIPSSVILVAIDIQPVHDDTKSGHADAGLQPDYDVNTLFVTRFSKRGLIHAQFQVLKPFGHKSFCIGSSHHFMAPHPPPL